MATHQEQLAKNLASIRVGLCAQDPSFTPSEHDIALSKDSAVDARKALLAAKQTNPASTPLATLPRHFYFKMAADHNKQRALTGVLMDTALPHALALDEAMAKAQETLLLYGFVLSIKDAIKKKGTKSTWGLFLSDCVCQDGVPFIEYLETKGAVIPVKTNVSQMLMMLECNNNIYGDCLHPFDAARNPGGSSGGDSCLVALKQVNVDIGSDYTGPGRIPAAFCGPHSIIFLPLRVDCFAHSGPLRAKTLPRVWCTLRWESGLLSDWQAAWCKT